jgi:hypothetical protein
MDWTSLLRVVVSVGTAGLALFAYRAARRERWPEPNLLVEELQCGDIEDDVLERWPPAAPGGGEAGFSFEHGMREMPEVPPALPARSRPVPRQARLVALAVLLVLIAGTAAVVTVSRPIADVSIVAAEVHAVPCEGRVPCPAGKVISVRGTTAASGERVTVHVLTRAASREEWTVAGVVEADSRGRWTLDRLRVADEREGEVEVVALLAGPGFVSGARVDARGLVGVARSGVVRVGLR